MAIPRDKQLHATAGATIGGLASLILIGLTGSPSWGMILGFAAAAVAGLGKELWDSKHGGHVELEDFLATCAGGFAGAAGAFVLTAVV